jgi:hypothetical protein
VFGHLTSCILPKGIARNVSVEWVQILHPVSEFSDSNLGPEPTIITQLFHGFRQSFQLNSRKVPQIQQRLLPCTFIPIHYSHTKQQTFNFRWYLCVDNYKFRCFTELGTLITKINTQKAVTQPYCNPVILLYARRMIIHSIQVI